MALVTNLNMGSLSLENPNGKYSQEATKAYINKLKAMYDSMPFKSPVISSYGTGIAGSTYYFEDTYGYDTDPTNVLKRKEAVSSSNPGALVDYHPHDGTLIREASDVKGFMTWGTHGNRSSTYAKDNSIKFKGNSAWWLIETIESWNGTWEGYGQGNFIDWFSKNAFGSLDYEYTPVGAVSHVWEPSLCGINDPGYFRAWEEGQLFADCAWSSRQAPSMMAVGDPLVSPGRLDDLTGIDSQ